MSAVSAQGEFDFWEFVNCGICHLEFVKESGTLSTTPFWLTECGHVVCNSHLNADQSCAECGAPGVLVMSLVKEMEPPMSNWFESATLAFDAVGYTLRFQINTLASLVRYFKRKYIQYRPLYERLKEEHAETKRLRKMVDELKQENQQLKSRLQTYGDRINENHKRQRVDDDGRYLTQRTSSPRSVTSVPTPVGPDRLTLPPDHHQPHFNSRQPLRTYASSTPRQSFSQYAYAPPRSAQAQTMAAPTLSHTQSGSIRHAQAREQGETSENYQTMPPPPVPVNRNTDPRSQKPILQLDSSASHPLPQRPSNHPPSTPQSSSSTVFRFTPQTPMRGSTASVSMTTTRPSMPGPNYTTPQQGHRFLPSSNQRNPATATSVPLATAGRVSQAPSRSPMSVSGSGGQRTPFVPGTAGGRS